jgi:hypothetical protein
MKEKLKKFNLNWIVMALLVLVVWFDWWLLLIPVYILMVLTFIVFCFALIAQLSKAVKFRHRVIARTNRELFIYWSNILAWVVNLYAVIHLGHIFLATLMGCVILYTLSLYNSEPIPDNGKKEAL